MENVSTSINASAKSLYVIGTFDTKGAELFYVCECIRMFYERIAQPINIITVDVSALFEHRSAEHSPANIIPDEIARHHPDQLTAQEIFADDRGCAIENILQALTAYMLKQNNIAGVIGLGGSGGTALISPALRTLPVGIPKLLVSTVASGNTKPYIGASDITMMYSVADIAGLNRITRKILSNAANAIAGMMLGAAQPQLVHQQTKPAIGLTMFGVTTPCVSAVCQALTQQYDCLVFHATGSGGQAMEKLTASGELSGVIDATTTEIADHLFGGVFSAGKTRLDSIIKSKTPYVGSAGALDMVNFGAPETIPAKYAGRTFHKHNPQVTLMRTTIEENVAMGAWVAAKLNQCQGPVRFLFPLEGVSALSQKGQPFYHPEADYAFFETLQKNFKTTSNKKLIALPYSINDPAFSAAIVENFLALQG